VFPEDTQIIINVTRLTGSDDATITTNAILAPAVV